MTDLFHYLTSDDLRLLAEKAKRRSCAVGDLILNEGTDARGIFVLRAGKVKVVKQRLSAAPVVVSELGPGEVFGDMSFIDNQPVSASVVAVEASEIDIIASADVYALLASVPGLSSRFFQSLALTLSERLRTTTNNLACL